MNSRVILSVFLFSLVLLGSEGYALFNPSKTNNELGKKALQEKDVKKALQYFKKALGQNSKDPWILNNIATVLHTIGTFDEAEAVYLQALEHLDIEKKDDGDDEKTLKLSKLYYNLANNYFLSEKYVEALEAYKKSLQLNDKDIQSKKNLELTLERLEEQNTLAMQDQYEDETGSSGANKQKPRRLPLEQQQEPSNANNSQPKKTPNNKNPESSQDERSQENQQGANSSSSLSDKQPGTGYKQSAISKERADQILKSIEQKNIDLRKLNPFQYPKPKGRYNKEW